MKLIKLYSDNSDFKTIEFNLTGFTFILAKKKINNKDDKSTFNGVGKSLIIALIHFCLGSDKSDELSKLDNWTFFLDIKIGKNEFTIRRNTKDQDIIFLDDEDYTCRKFNEKILSLLNEELNMKFLKFRSMLCRFIRPSKKSYIEFDKPITKEIPYSVLLNSLFLLGFNAELIEEKYNLKEKLDEYNQKKKNFEKDDIINEFFFTNENKKDFSQMIRDLKLEIEQKEIQKQKFKIAENYSDLVKETKEIRNQISEVEHKLFLKNEILGNIQENISRKTELSKTKLLNLFKETKIALDSNSIKRLEEVEKFHSTLTRTRKKRLQDELDFVENEIKVLKESIINLQIKFNSKSLFLKEHGAVEEYEKLTETLFSLKKKLQKLESYNIIIKKYDRKISDTKINLEKANISTNKYLEEVEIELENLHKDFNRMIESFYGKGSKTGSISLVNNDGENQTRFDFNVSVEGDSSDGINAVKIFSYDVLLLKKYPHHHFNFIFHDSRLFYNIDENQIRLMFIYLSEFFKKNDVQYICSLNQNQYEKIKEKFDEYNDLNRFNEIFVSEGDKKTIKLVLSDESDKTKLLGGKYEIKYDG